MRNNTIVKGAVGAMLFGGTLGVVGAADAGLTFTNDGVSPTLNYAYNMDTSANFGFNRSFAAFSNTSGDVTVSWSATTASGFSTFVTSSISTYQVATARTFTVTGTQEVTLSWSGSQIITFGLASGGGYTAVSGLGAGWTTGLAGSQTAESAGSVTVTLNAGEYKIYNELDAGDVAGPSSFGFAVVPAPGALALLGVAGIVGSRRRR